MKKSCADLKGQARESLLGNYGPLIAALLLTWLISVLINMPFDNMLQQGIEFNVVSRIAVGLVGTILVSLVTILFSAGLSHMHLNVARKMPVRIQDVFYAFRCRPDRYIGFGLFMILIGVGCLLPGSICISYAVPYTVNTVSELTVSLGLIIGIFLTLLGLIIMLYFTLAFAMTVLILLNDNQILLKHAMSNSMRLMKGKKWKLLKLYLSFIPIILLSILTLGLGLLWIVPYMDQSVAQFYFMLVPDPEPEAQETI